MTAASPIFVAGLDHSGKTVLRAALRRHASIEIVRHLEMWTRLRARHAAGGPGHERLLDALTTGRAAALELDRGQLAEASAGAFGDLVREIGRQLCERGARRWGAQEALLEFETTRVLEELPDARVLCLVRDPRERCAAMLRSRAVGRGGVAAETAAWVASARAAMRAAAARADAVRIVRYEALIGDPEATLREVCAFVGEPFVPVDRPAAVATPAAPPLAAADVAFIQQHARSELAALGYRLEPVPARTAMLPDRLVDATRWQVGRLAWRRRSRHLGSPFAARGG